MAQKRMFDKSIIENDYFMDLPITSKALYFLLGMEADDEGFVSPKRVIRLYGGTEDDIKVLVAKNFLIQFESGVVVVTDWKENNWLDKRRIKETKYLLEKSMLKTENNKYIKVSAKPMLSKRLESIEENSIEENRRVYGEFENVKLTDEEIEKLKTRFNDWENKIEKLSMYMASKNVKYKSHYATILNWAKKDEPKKVNEPAWLNIKIEKEECNDKELEEILSKYD